MARGGVNWTGQGRGIGAVAMKSGSMKNGRKKKIKVNGEKLENHIQIRG